MNTITYVKEKIINQLVYYVIDGRYRKSVLLRPWLEEQVKNPSNDLLELVNQIPTYKNKDKQMWAIFLWVRNNFIWTEDWKTWKTFEYWSTANEMAEMYFNLNGHIKEDCESGATFIYVLARLKDIPSDNMLIFAGDVQMAKTAETGGHAWLGYYPDDKPFHFYVLDWCYHFDATPMYRRNLFAVYLDKIFEFKKGSVKNKYIQVNSKYKKLWLGFNEKLSFKKLKYKIKVI